jgi:hypothetical protein
VILILSESIVRLPLPVTPFIAAHLSKKPHARQKKGNNKQYLRNKTNALYYSHAVAQWFSHCNTRWQVAEYIPDYVIGMFH